MNEVSGYIFVLVVPFCVAFAEDVGVNKPIEMTIGSRSLALTTPSGPIPAPGTIGPGLCIIPLPVPMPIPLLISTGGPTAPLCKLDIGTCECGAGDIDERDGKAGYAGVTDGKLAYWAPSSAPGVVDLGNPSAEEDGL